MTQNFDALEANVPSFMGIQMGVGGTGIFWYYDTLSPGLRSYPVKTRVLIAEAAELLAQQAEQYMKEHAPWQDRTGDAREGLTAEAQGDLTSQEIVLYHTVDYGIWLEIRWSGAYAIIVPTIEKFGPEFMTSLGEGGSSLD